MTSLKTSLHLQSSSFSLWVAFRGCLFFFLCGLHSCKALTPHSYHHQCKRRHYQSSVSNSISTLRSYRRKFLLSPATSEAPRNPAPSSLWATSDDDSNPIDDNDNSENLDDDSNDAAFYREYQKAKLDKLGWDIPPEQLQASAASAEQEFLKAMEQCQSDFEEAKEDLEEGALSAADFFLEQIKKEEALEELWSKQAEEDDEEDDEMEESDEEASDEDYFQ